MRGRGSAHEAELGHVRKDYDKGIGHECAK